MKVVCFDKIINLDKFESVCFRTSFWGDEYPVEATRHETSGGLFGGVGTAVEEIARFKHAAVAKALVKAITDGWLANEQVFDVEKWIKEEAPAYTPEHKPTAHEKLENAMVDAAINLMRIDEEQKKQAETLQQIEKEALNQKSTVS